MTVQRRDWVITSSFLRPSIKIDWLEPHNIQVNKLANIHRTHMLIFFTFFKKILKRPSKMKPKKGAYICKLGLVLTDGRLKARSRQER